MLWSTTASVFAPDEAVLCAVMAERRRRDSERLVREERLRERLLR